MQEQDKVPAAYQFDTLLNLFIVSKDILTASPEGQEKWIDKREAKAITQIKEKRT